jgi:hypothetical protein
MNRSGDRRAVQVTALWDETPLAAFRIEGTRSFSVGAGADCDFALPVDPHVIIAPVDGQRVVVGNLTFVVDALPNDVIWVRPQRRQRPAMAFALIASLTLHLAAVWGSARARTALDPIDPSTRVRASELALIKAYLVRADEREAELDVEGDGGAARWHRRAVPARDRAPFEPSFSPEAYGLDSRPPSPAHSDDPTEEERAVLPLLMYGGLAALLESAPGPLPTKPSEPLWKKQGWPRPRTSVRQGPLTVQGGLSPDVIGRVVRESFGRFRVCYDDSLSTDPNLAGRVEVKFVIDRSGKVSSISNGVSEIPDPRFVACLFREFRNLSFPPPAGDVVSVVFPVMFAPGG